MTDFEGVVTMCEDAICAGVMPGIALSVHAAGCAPFRVSMGSAALEPQSRPLQSATRFDLASLTKCLATTWLLMRRWDAGLDLDAPLGELLPGYYPADKQALTPRLLMTHAAGLPSGLRLQDHLAASEADQEGTRQKVIDCFLAAESRAAPRQDTLYSDIGPILIGDLLEKLPGGGRLDHLCLQELFGPAGMSHTGYVHLTDPHPAPPPPPEQCAATERCAWRGRVVSGQVHDETAYLLSGVAGHAGLFAPLADVDRAARLLLEAPADGPASAAAIRHFTQRQNLVAGSTRAIGWDTARDGCPGGSRLSASAFGHTGFTGTSIWVDPQRQLSIVVLANRVHPSRDNGEFLTFRPRLHDAVIDAL